VSRPEISVVMPFAGDAAAAAAALDALLALQRRTGDELILADNSGTAPAAEGVRVVRAADERSPAHARNVGASHATRAWILFLDADCRGSADLLDAYFAEPVDPGVGALAGEVVAAASGDSLVARYGAARSFLSQQAHMEHPFRPRAVAANLLVRRDAFEQIGGFYEGVRAAEDTDFSWRLQAAGWRLELRPDAFVVHRYRASLSELRRQWRGYAAGRAWLARRYEGFEPEPAVARALRRAVRGRARGGPRAGRATGGGGVGRARRLDRGAYFAIDAMLSVEELAGFALSNRPTGGDDHPGAGVVLVADRFPARGDPLVDLARTLAQGARVEAVARPERVAVQVGRALPIDYREDDGVAARVRALVWILARHPLRCALDLTARRPRTPKLSALAPAARRLSNDPAARVLPLGSQDVHATAARLARLAGRRLERPPAA
jgi:GT2 family glycosyltransferase